ncbi:MAG TPA: aldehyde dehydrogenase family protein [Mycobacteriales bacterium]|nr:aldehyde dehydrogenase family protein [Mycobacteriales bacterium]
MSRTFTSVNPARPTEVVGEFTAASVADVSAAVEAAARAQLDWAERTPAQRATLVAGVAHALARQTPELTELITREEGKTLSDSAGEVRKSVEQFHFASQLCYQVEGTTYPSEQPGTFTYSLRSPVGVVVAITPWNFPLSLPARKIAAALAAGNAVVFKPSPVTAAVGEALVRTIRDAGLPDQLVQVVHGDDPAAMATLVGHHAVRAISLTGSDRVGEKVREASHRHARLQAELSGHNVSVVCADADLPAAAAEVVPGAFGLSGQACTAASRVLVDRAVLAGFTELLAARVRALTCGPGDAPGVDCGPLATVAQFERVDGLARAARRDGTVLAEGELRDDRDPEGYYLAPLLVGGLGADHTVNATETFGPILSVLPVNGLDEALDVVNRDDYGLASAIHTTSLGTAQRFAREVRCGVVKVNQRTTGNGIAAPFGGWKASSSGAFPEGGAQALDFFTETKTVYCRG